MIDKPVADEKVEGGCIRAWAAFEVLAVNKDVAQKSLNQLMENIEKDSDAEIYEKEFSELVEVKNPTKQIKEAFSITCDIKFIVKNIDKLMQFVMTYGPSAVEILEPNELNLNIGEMQSILNAVSTMMHKFAAAGVGGLVFVNKE